MKQYITAAALLAAGSVLANAAVTTITFSPQNNAPSGDNQRPAWNVSGTNGYYVGTTLDVQTDFTALTWGAMTGTSQIMNQNQLPLDEGTIVPYASTQPTNYGITFTLTAGESALTISSLTFTFVGAYNGGSFDNAYNASAKSESTTITLTSGGASKQVTQTISATSLAMVQGSATIPEGNIVTLAFDSPVSVNANGTVDFTLAVTQNTINTGLKSIAVNASSIPEPSAFGLLAGLGALALVASRRRRK